MDAPPLRQKLTRLEKDAFKTWAIANMVWEPFIRDRELIKTQGMLAWEAWMELVPRYLLLHEDLQDTPEGLEEVVKVFRATGDQRTLPEFVSSSKVDYAAEYAANTAPTASDVAVVQERRKLAEAKASGCDVSPETVKALPTGPEVSEREVIAWVADNLSNPTIGFQPDMGTCPAKRAYNLLWIVEGSPHAKLEFLRKYMAANKPKEMGDDQLADVARVDREQQIDRLERLKEVGARLKAEAGEDENPQGFTVPVVVDDGKFQQPHITNGGNTTKPVVENTWGRRDVTG